jgi:HEAT repeat protein
MSKSRQELLQQLSDIEPTERTFDGIGPEDVDLLRDLLGEDEGWLAARAVHALSRIDSDEARKSVEAAAQNAKLEVRVAAASASDRLPPAMSDRILDVLLRDAEPSVRKVAIKSVADSNSVTIKERVAEMADNDHDARLREIADEKRRTLPR